MAEEHLNLIQKLAKIRSISDVAQKSKKGYNYTYTDITEILANVTAGMKKYHVSLVPSIVPGTSEIGQNVVHNTKTDKTGRTYETVSTEMLYRAEMIFKWIDDDNPDDNISVPWFVTGSQSDPSQAMGGGLTYTTRYFLTSFFQIAQSDLDVDAYRSKQKEAEASEDKEVARQIIEELDRIVRGYLADNNEAADTVKKFMTKYIKGGNYLNIKDPEMAAKLLNDFKIKFIDKKEQK